MKNISASFVQSFNKFGPPQLAVKIEQTNFIQAAAIFNLRNNGNKSEAGLLLGLSAESTIFRWKKASIA